MINHSALAISITDKAIDNALKYMERCNIPRTFKEFKRLYKADYIQLNLRFWFVFDTESDFVFFLLKFS